jgi:hypothetical protein
MKSDGFAPQGGVGYEPRSIETPREACFAKLATVLEVEPAELLIVSSRPNT